MTGIDIREKRNDIGLSQSKLADITGVEQARISAYELGKLNLTNTEIIKISKQLEIIDEHTVLKLKKKRFQNSQHLESIILQIPRRGYKKTNRNIEYLKTLNGLENQFQNPPKKGLRAISFFAG